MFNKLPLPILLSVLLFAAASSTAGESTGLCPMQIETTQTPVQTPSGWSVLSQPGASRLSNAAIFDGHPDQQAELAPSSSKTSKRVITNMWKFGAMHNGSVWLKCSYTDTGLTLARQLEASTSGCTLSYDARFSPPAIISVVCR